MSEETPDDGAVALGYEPIPEDEWALETEELPPRRRRKLLAPVPLTLLAVLLVAAGFLAGVEVEKGETSSSAPGTGLSGFAALRRSLGAAGGGASAGGASSGGASGAPAGFPGASSLGGGLTTGEVSYVSGDTLYVTDSEGTTVKVHAPAGTRVTKTVTTAVHSIHPGQSVVIRGSQAKNGIVTASSISLASSEARSSLPSTGGTQLFGAG